MEDRETGPPRQQAPEMFRFELGFESGVIALLFDRPPSAWLAWGLSL